MASIARRPDGTYRPRYRDATGKEHARHFKRKVDAQRWLDEVTASIVTGQYVDPAAGKITFRSFFDDWSQRQVWAAGTVTHMNLVARSVTFADVPLKAVRGSHVEAWVKAMHTDGLAPLTIANRFTAVRTIFRAAVRDRRITSDPTADVSRPPKKPSSREQHIEVPTLEDVSKLLAVTDPRMRAYVGVCAFGGLRLGEASAVRVDAIDFLKRTLRVERQVQYKPGFGAEVKDPKHGSKREVFIADELAEMLARHIAEHGTSAEGWLFYNGAGRPLPPSTVDSWWQRTVKAAGVAGLHIHGLRHFYASGLIAAGCDVVTVQRALGHARPSLTLDVYSHLWPTAEDRTRKASAAMLRDVLARSADSLRTEVVS
ncbi:site-specific integrase [Modestobacter sp. VKM Ac-2983]|uniref:tyrosine-type recombinase/integrase n=1 Tax=Modestobacter sp. VKM Ac-2983 TaxID=3004137 RepID=UPI0022AB5D34|nr:site-specific integrase [Modestobacter sp. VKM Ac-2983]MCZ2804330.1 site-specific integrase [Modestobacter sp. VKM Ac-2983]